LKHISSSLPSPGIGISQGLLKRKKGLFKRKTLRKPFEGLLKAFSSCKLHSQQGNGSLGKRKAF
jgi:hypothetical protein